LVGGEALTRDVADRLLGRAAEVWNLYGPTETTIWSTLCRVAPGNDPVPIGRPIANTSLYILDTQRQPVPIGVAGELYIGGDGLARGYCGRPELTAERFVPDPFAEGARLYRTGDLARYRADGDVEYLGRLDQQVKVRGFRIELQEIEAALKEHPRVANAVVVARAAATGDARLAAYLVPGEGEAPSPRECRKLLRRTLPDYMLPSSFTVLEALPLTPNGKIDRRALPVPEEEREQAGSGPAAPRTALEKLLVEVWEETLGVRPVGIHDNFFDLGGHSLLAMRVVALVERRAGLRLAPRQFIMGTLEQIAAANEPGAPPPAAGDSGGKPAGGPGIFSRERDA
jgi:acyl-coenzyme A synthetase/AMP-(fatty) acid ligase